MNTFSPEGIETKRVVIGGVLAELSSHRLGERFVARVNDIEAGAIIGRGRGGTREQAEEAAIEGASLRLELTEARRALQSSVARLKG
jgi:hypothetical protein